MSALNVYSYYDAAGFRKFADFDDVVFTGTWSSTGTYLAVAMQVANYGQSQFIAIVDSVNKNPLVQPTKWNPIRYWSPFVLVIPAGGTSSGDATYQIAVTGSNIAVAAYGIATSGSNLAVFAASTATSAFSVAVSGLSTAQTAQASASAALTMAQAGTDAADAALDAANTALIVAQSGTDLATAAWTLAQIGTNVGTNALNAAQAAQTTASSAFNIAVAGTSTAGAAQSTATAAYALATSGTDTANTALSLSNTAQMSATAAQSTANAAYALGQTGTNAAATSLSAANAALVLAQTGTAAAGAAQSTADAAFALAELGTIIPPLHDLPDVSIPAPTAQQVLLFDGSRWIAGDAPSTAASSAFTFFLNEAFSGTLDYQTLSTFPSGGTEEIDSMTVQDGTTTQSTTFISDFLNRTLIDAGIWEFNVYSTVSSGAATLSVAILTVSLNGQETELFRVSLPEVTNTEPLLDTVISTQASYPTQLTDKLAARFYGTTSSPTPLTLSFYHNGSEHYSHFHTPLRTVHNDLAGLQGGALGQFYHVTLDQNNALAGTSGAPSASNLFVTQQSLAAEQGTRSSKDQDLQNQVTTAQSTATQASATASQALAVASTGTDTASSSGAVAAAAYALAVTGTNAAASAQSTANGAQSTADAAYTLAQTGTNAAANAQSTANSALTTKLDLTGGTLTGNLVVPNVQTSAGTFALTGPSGGTVTYSFLGPTVQRTKVDRNIYVNVTDMGPVRDIALVLEATGNLYTLGWSSQINFFGTTAPTSIQNNHVLVALTSIGTTLDSVIAASTVSAATQAIG